MDLVDIVLGLSGQCPCTQWTLSMDLVDVVHGPSFQYFSRIMSTVHGLSTGSKCSKDRADPLDMLGLLVFGPYRTRKQPRSFI